MSDISAKVTAIIVDKHPNPRRPSRKHWYCRSSYFVHRRSKSI